MHIIPTTEISDLIFVVDVCSKMRLRTLRTQCPLNICMYVRSMWKIKGKNIKRNKPLLKTDFDLIIIKVSLGLSNISSKSFYWYYTMLDYRKSNNIIKWISFDHYFHIIVIKPNTQRGVALKHFVFIFDLILLCPDLNSHKNGRPFICNKSLGNVS